MPRELINDEKKLDEVVGGFMHFNGDTKVMTYMHEENGTVTRFNCVKYNRAWQMSNYYHSKGLHEDQILSLMLKDGCIVPA